jgi:hypothetical protein
MKLPILAARIHPRGQIRQQLRIKPPSSKPAIQLPRINACYICGKAAREHSLRQPPRLDPPQRKHGSQSTPSKLLLPISPNILQKKIPENHMPHSLIPRPPHRLAHRRFINLIRTRRRNRNLDQRQSRRRSLHLQQTLPHSMHGHSPMRAIHSSQQPNHIQRASFAHRVQSPSAILPAAPSQPSLGPTAAMAR